MGRRLLLPLSLALLCAGCGVSVPSPGPDAAGPPSRDEFVEHGLRPLGESRAELRQSLGEPDSISARVVPNRHVPGAHDTLFTVHYPGLVAHLHRPGPGGEMLAGAEVTDNRYLRYPQVGIGATPRELQGALGLPDEPPDSVYTYSCHACEGVVEPVRLFLRDGRVRRIVFSFYVD